MSDQPNPEPGGAGLFVGLFVLLLRLAFTCPYYGLAGIAALAVSGRDRVVARIYAYRLGEDGKPLPEPLPPLEELRRRFLERLPNPDGLVREPDLFAAERWLVLGTRVVTFATLGVAAAVFSGTGFVAWRYAGPWAEARVAAAPWSGVPLVAAAAAGAWAATGWLALGTLPLTASWGPVSWFADWCVRRAHHELWGGSPPADAVPADRATQYSPRAS